ncbi:MAG: iron-containing alcohol dehydrogenase [Planctomycetaceae bacterium]
MGDLAKKLGRRAILLRGNRSAYLNRTHSWILSLMEGLGLEVDDGLEVRREPEVEDIDEIVESLRDEGYGSGDFIVGMGGGAVLDTAKAVAAHRYEQAWRLCKRLPRRCWKRTHNRSRPAAAARDPDDSGDRIRGDQECGHLVA